MNFSFRRRSAVPPPGAFALSAGRIRRSHAVGLGLLAGAMAGCAQTEPVTPDFARQLLDSAHFEHDSPSRLILPLERAMALSVDGPAEAALRPRLESWAGKWIRWENGIRSVPVGWLDDAQALDSTPAKRWERLPAPVRDRLRALRARLFKSGDDEPVADYAEFLQLDREVRELEAQAALERAASPDRTVSARTAAAVRLAVSRRGAFTSRDGEDLRILHEEHDGIVRQFLEPVAANVGWMPAAARWLGEDGWAAVSRTPGLSEGAPAWSCQVKSVALLGEGASGPVAPGRARIVGLILVRDPAVGVARPARPGLFAALRERWAAGEPAWFGSLPLVTGGAGVWDDTEITLHVAFTGGALRWREAFVFAVVLQLPPADQDRD